MEVIVTTAFVFLAGVGVGFVVTVLGIIAAESEPADEIDVREVQRRIEGRK